MTLPMEFPENTPETLYLWGDCTIGYITEMAQDHFGQDIDVNDLKITPIYEQVRSFGYDRYDSSDYMSFLEITKA